MTKFLSCDWGTSSFRLKLVDTTNLHVLGTSQSDEGIASTFKLWNENTHGELAKRKTFYLNIIKEHIKKIEDRLSISLDEVPIIISGMASSTLGMMELPYAKIPFALDGTGALVEHIQPTQSFRHHSLLISGISSEQDVMRGEETQLLGCTQSLFEGQGNHILIFPGTHSKHIYVSNSYARGFKTYMTGEIFDLMITKSILQNSVESAALDTPGCMDSFLHGVHHAKKTNLLHAAFITRTNILFNKYDKKQNYNFLSGVLIGEELKDIPLSGVSSISLCASHLHKHYLVALEQLNNNNKTKIFSIDSPEEAVVRGQHKIYMQHHM